MMWRRLCSSSLAVLAVASVGAGVRVTNAASTSSASQPDILIFVGHLDASQVVGGSDSTATGTATIQIDTALKTLTTDLEWSGLSGPADRSHVHSGAEGTPTDDIFFHEVIQEEDRTVIPCPWPDSVFENCVPTSGSLHDVLDVSDGYGCTDFQCLIDTAVPNGFFIDMHTETSPGGEIRGQLVLVPPTGAPSSLAATVLSRSQVGLVWTDNAPNETGFRIERSLNGSSGWRQIGTVAANVKAYTHSRQRALTTSFYRVRATNTVGDSTYSNVASATTLG